MAVEEFIMFELYQGDCLEVMKSISDKSINLIVIDPPYNINKAKWDKINNYIEWMGLVFIECQRVLKDNGSFYFFHNDFLQIVELQNWLNNNSKFVFKQLIVWNKMFTEAKNKGYLQGFIEPEGLRNFQKMVEYILFYTFQDETGLTTVMLDTNNFSSLRKYFKEFQEAIGMTKKQVIELIGQQADHCFRWKSSQWDIPTKETYFKLKEIPLKYNFIGREYGDLGREYEDLRREYEDLRRQYEDLRYTFNNQKTHHSVWNYEIEKKQGHITPKPVKLLENIIRHSSNENDIVLDCFMGSGSTGVACINTNRNFIGIEKDEGYFKIAKERIEKASQDGEHLIT
jgi:site-specific DNA-methyltransferase (adenine-specific)